MAFEKWIKENPVKWDKSNYDSLDVCKRKPQLRGVWVAGLVKR